MGNLRIGKTLEEVNEMMAMRNRWEAKSLLAALCSVVAVLATASMAAGQGPLSSSTASTDRSYCVDMGYLYRTAPGINNGQGFCQFDGSWCDAHSFATGSCGTINSGFLNPYGYYYPYYYNAYYPYGLNYGGSIASCSSYNGSVQTIHTPYGDFDQCVLPDGRAIDLYGLHNGYPGDVWYSTAYSFLNPP
jgi:putative hemolysin